MSHEIQRLEQVALGTVRMLEYEIEDRLGGSFELASVRFSVRDSDGNVAVSGAGTVNNDDRDAAGSAIRTVGMEVDFGTTDFSAGHYQLTFTVSFSPATTDEAGDTDDFVSKLEVINYREVM